LIENNKNDESVSTLRKNTLILLSVSAQSFAQRGMKWKGGRGWRIGTQYGKMYNPKTAETISGEVISVDKFTPLKGMSYGVQAFSSYSSQQSERILWMSFDIIMGICL